MSNPRARAMASGIGMEVVGNSVFASVSSGILVGDLILLVQQLNNGGFGNNPSLLSGFTSWATGGYEDGKGDQVAVRVSAKTATAADIGATFTNFRRIIIIRDKGRRRLSSTGGVRTTTGAYNASALNRPIGFGYTVTRSDSTAGNPPGTLGTITGLTKDYEVVDFLLSGGARFQIRIGLWLGLNEPGTYTMTLGTSVGSDVFRRFHAIRRA